MQRLSGGKALGGFFFSQSDHYCKQTGGNGLTGEGDGMIVRRGFRKPPSFYDANLRAAPVGHFFDVMTNGYGAMYSYASRVATDDRWRIAAYIRTLQTAENAPAALAQQGMNQPAGNTTGQPGTTGEPGGAAGGTK